MTPEQFTYWLNGFLDCKENLTQKETQKIKENLNKVFNKVTPNCITKQNTHSIKIC